MAQANNRVVQGQAENEKAGEFGVRRESVHRSVLRANRAVAAMLMAALLLGVAMLGVSYRAHQNQRRAERAEASATERLWGSYLAQARAERLSTEAGHRAAALAAISNAAAIRPSIELRDEALAALGVRDLVREVTWPLEPRAYGFHFDPELEHYVTSYAPDELSLFRLSDNSLVRTFRAADAGLNTNAAVREFFFSMTGRYVTIQYSTGEVVLWERDTGRVGVVLGREPDQEKIAWVPSFTADDRYIFARSASARHRVVIRDLMGEFSRSLHVTGVNDSVRLSPKGDVFLWFRRDQIHLHEATNGALVRTFAAPAEVQALWWDAKGEQFSVACRDATVHVCDLAMARFRQFGGRAVNAWMQQFSPDGSLLVTAGADGTSRLWDVGDARLVAETTSGRAFVFGRDGERIAFGTPGREIGLWKITQPTAYRLLQGRVAEYASVWQQDLSADGSWIVWAPPSWVSRRGFELFDLTGKHAPHWVNTSREVAVGFHPAKPMLFVGGADGLKAFPLPERGHEFVLEKHEQIELPDGFEPRAFSFSAGGEFLTALSTSGQIIVLRSDQPGDVIKFDHTVGRAEPSGPASRTGSGGLAISPDGRWVVAGWAGHDAPLVWDVRTGKIAGQLKTSTGNVVFSRDGKFLAAVSASSCSLWRVDGWKLQWKQPRAPMLSVPGAVAFSDDGDVMAYAHGVDQVALVATETGDRVVTLRAPMLIGIAGIRLASDGRTLAVAGTAGKIHLWDLQHLRSELGKLDLDWPLEASATALAATRFRSGEASLAIAGTAIVGVGIAGLLGLLVLRRHARLTRDFVSTTELAVQQERELAAQRELNELKSRFVSMVSHEFRTPLGITMSAVELLRNYAERLSPEKLKELLEDIYSATLRMSGMMEQVLLLGRVEAGKIAFRKVPIDVPVFLSRLADETRSATDNRCPIDVAVDGDFSGAQGDESLLHHALGNLLSNAVKYSPENGRVWMGVRREGDDALFVVRDEGIGIPAADQARLFDAFHRASNVGQRPGTGLGLLIVKRCAELHQGSVSFESQVNRGTEFRLRVPLFK